MAHDIATLTSFCLAIGVWILIILQSLFHLNQLFQARHRDLPLAASLGLTFIYNVTLGIPIYLAVAEHIVRTYPVF